MSEADSPEPTDATDRALRILVAKWAVKDQAERLAQSCGRLVRLLALDAQNEPNPGTDATACIDERSDAALTGPDGATVSAEHSSPAATATLCHNFAPPPDGASCHDDPPSKPIIEETPFPRSRSDTGTP